MDSRDLLLQALHEVQDRSPGNWVSLEEQKQLCARFGLSKAELRGVASYYSLLSLAPRGRHVIRLCVSPVCRMIGSLDILDLLRRELGVEVGATTEDGVFTLEESQCLGRCSGAPAMMVDDRVYERLDAQRLSAIIGELRAGGAREVGHG